jgi:archaellum component FlaC
MSERTADATTTVDEDGIRVEKSFTDDAFPVPAVMYELSSTREDPVRVRIVDRVPESFPMDRIGFHPDYESENWTAYKDHRVEFERVLEPGDAVETVFGIRDDDPDLDGFLGNPVIEHVPVGEEIEDVLGTGDTDAVREVLSGDRATLPGMDEPLAEEGDAVTHESEESDTTEEQSEPVEETDLDTAPAPRAVAEGGRAAVTPHTAEDEDLDAGETDAEEPASATEPETATEPEDPGEPVDANGSTDHPIEAPAAPADSGLAAALAAEIRSGTVDESDLETLRSELDVGVPKSVDVRIARLQSSVADIEAYADALAEFIDGEGTAREILDELDEQVDAVEAEMAAIDDRLDAGETARTDLREDVSRIDESVDSVAADVDDVEADVSSVDEAVSDVEATVGEVADDVAQVNEETAEIGRHVDDLDDDIETLYEQVDDAAAGVEATEDRVDDVESRLGRFDEEFDDLWDDLAEVDTRLTDIEDRLGEDLDDVEAELDAINDHLEELEAFRKRLNEAFGP